MVNLQPNPRFRADAACVLGSTGSVGTQTLDVLREMNVPVVMMTAGENTALFAEQIREFSPRIAAVLTEEAARELTGILTERGIPLPEILWHGGEILDAVRQTEADIIFHSISGLAGLPSALAAANSGKRVAMANKEAIIACGELIFQRLAASGGELIPVDSEHSAIFQCLQSPGRAPIDRLVLTASGGPFREKPADLSAVTPEMALAHPVWKMGPKVTVDSSTMMNKGFEVLEARWLFDIPVERIDVAVHPESIVHSLVEFVDGATLAQLSPPDMRVAIQYALTWPGRIASKREKLDLAAIGSLTFRKPDEKRFPCLALAKRACAMGGSYPATLAAADEWAVARFAEGRISYLDIARTVEKCLDAAPDFGTDSIESTMEANDWTWKYLSRQAI